MGTLGQAGTNCIRNTEGKHGLWADMTGSCWAQGGLMSTDTDVDTGPASVVPV